MLQLLGSVVFGIMLVISLVAYAIGSGGGGEAKLDYKVYYKDQLISGAYKVYGNPELQTWVAKVVISNTGNAPLKNLRVSYSINTYGDEAPGDAYAALLPNGTIVDTYYPVLSSKVTELTAAANSNLRIKITYQDSSGVQKEESTTKSIKLLGVNDFVFSSLGTEESTGSFLTCSTTCPFSRHG
jgi:hypothetical protein